MKFLTYSRNVVVAVLLGWGTTTCTNQTSVISITEEGDTLELSVVPDTLSVSVDTVLVAGDTVVVVVSDTIVTPADTVVIVVLDTVSTTDTIVQTVVDTVVVSDTVLTSTVDTVVSGTDTVVVVVTDTTIVSEEVVVVNFDTTVVTDTVVNTVIDTVVQFDTVVEVRTDTVVQVDTLLVVDTVFTPLPTLNFSVSELILQVGESKTVSVTTLNALGLPGTSDSLTWVSENPTVASVTQEGGVSGLAVGSTRVFVVSSQALSSTLPVQVVDSVTVPDPSVGVPLRDPGPNLPPGLEESFVFDVTRPDQLALNPDALGENPSTLWSAPESNRGLFVDRRENGQVFARFVWADGDRTRIAGNSVRLPTEFSEAYVRITWRANAGWQGCSNTVKQFFFQHSPWNPDLSMNLTVGVQGVGFPIAMFNSSPEARGPTPANFGEWVDDEWHLTGMGSEVGVRGWRNGALEMEAEGIISGNVAPNVLYLGPWHGGNCNKTQAGDFWDILRFVVWTR